MLEFMRHERIEVYNSSMIFCGSGLVINDFDSQGAHVTINARSEMDLEEDNVLGKVANASGANFSFHKEKARPMPEQGAVVSRFFPKGA